MMLSKRTILFSCIFLSVITASYGQDWAAIKQGIYPEIASGSGYDTAYRQPLASLGWEDGIQISPDGLTLYCTYVPIDFLSFVLNGDLPNDFSENYNRDAPLYGMDMETNSIGASEWLHSDIMIAERSSVNETFESWTLSGLAKPFYSEGAPTPFVEPDGTMSGMLFTSNHNDTNNTDIWWLETSEINPSGEGAAISAAINTSANEDNPNLTRVEGDSLILFFDSDNRAGGSGGHDIWYAASGDNGVSWYEPVALSAVNTESTEHQPFLYQEGAAWYLYYTAIHTDGKSAIYRVAKLSATSWDEWGTPELIVSSGNAAGIGEPTLTTSGDLSFVVIYEDPDDQSAYNHYDGDPWMLTQKKKVVLSSGAQTSLHIWPNPTDQVLNLNMDQGQVQQIRVFDLAGQEYRLNVSNSTGKTMMIDVSQLAAGQYVLQITTDTVVSIKFLVR